MRTSDFTSPTVQSGLSRGAASKDQKRQIGYRHSCVGGQAFCGRDLRGRRPVYARQLSDERHSNSSRRQYVFDWNRRDL